MNSESTSVYARFSTSRKCKLSKPSSFPETFSKSSRKVSFLRWTRLERSTVTFSRMWTNSNSSSRLHSAMICSKDDPILHLQISSDFKFMWRDMKDFNESGSAPYELFQVWKCVSEYRFRCCQFVIEVHISNSISDPQSANSSWLSPSRVQKPILSFRRLLNSGSANVKFTEILNLRRERDCKVLLQYSFSDSNTFPCHFSVKVSPNICNSDIADPKFISICLTAFDFLW